jgi:hypothetical protein
MKHMSISEAIHFGRVADQYQQLRREHPVMPVLTIKRFIDCDGNGLTLEQFQCETERGHRWSYTGSAYGGDDESFHGEGRCYCSNCGADGDA